MPIEMTHCLVSRISRVTKLVGKGSILWSSGANYALKSLFTASLIQLMFAIVLFLFPALRDSLRLTLL